MALHEWNPAGMSTHGVPSHLREGLQRYVEQGIPTGSGLRRVLENAPVLDVIAGLDRESCAGLRGLVRFLYNDAPSACWGSREAVETWLSHHGLAGAPEG